jgi:hypothetical protein
MRLFRLVLFTKYYYSDQFKGDMMGGTCSTRSREGNAYKTLVRKPEGKRPFGTRGEDNTKMDIKGIGYGVDSSGSVQGSVVGSYE